MDNNQDLDSVQKVLQVEDMIRWSEEKSYLMKKSDLAEKELQNESQPPEEISSRLLETSARLFKQETENAIQDKLYQMLKESDFLEEICYGETADSFEEEQKNFIWAQLQQIATLSENILPLQKEINDARATVMKMTVQLRDLTEKRMEIQDQLNKSQQEDDETKTLRKVVDDLTFNVQMTGRVLSRLILNCCKNLSQDKEVTKLLFELGKV